MQGDAKSPTDLFKACTSRKREHEKQQDANNYAKMLFPNQRTVCMGYNNREVKHTIRAHLSKHTCIHSYSSPLLHYLALRCCHCLPFEVEEIDTLCGFDSLPFPVGLVGSVMFGVVNEFRKS